MINLQDVLLLKGLACGPFWSNEGVFVSLLNLEFLGIDWFQLEKLTVACCGKYLEDSGLKNVLVENETYRPNTVNSVMRGSHYVRGKRGMSSTAEALGHVQLSSFFNQAEFDRYKSLFDTITETQSMFEADGSDQEISL